jgi:acetaldehyde dehydrogenase (acetylating)
MRHWAVALILATGGTPMVRAAHSAGKPAYGVGPGNVPVYVDRTADLDRAAYHIVNSKAFDYSVICSTEQAVVADRPIADELARRMEREGAVFVDAEQAAALGRALFHPDGAINPRSVGKSPQALAELADIRVPAHARILVARLSRVGPDEPLSREKLTTVLAFYESDGWEAGCDRSIELLKFGGDGHTLVIHCRDENVIVRFALEKPAFRIVVNQPGTLGAIGYTSGLDPAMTLATGGIGGGISSDNISVRHLLNVKRLAYPLIEWNWRSPAVSTALAAGLPAAVPAAGAGPATLAAALRAGPPSREEIDALVRRLLADDNR